MQTASAATRLLCVGDGDGAAVVRALGGPERVGDSRFAVETVVGADAATDRLTGANAETAGTERVDTGADGVGSGGETGGANGDDAVDCVVISDASDAVAVFESVRAAAPDLPVVLIVDSAPTTAVAAGVTEYVHRDAPPDRLAARIETAVQRRQRERKLERRNERLAEFADVVSHDIRGPLNVAAGYLDQAEQTGSQAAFRSVRDAHNRIQAIVEDVLTLARQGRTIGETEPVALAEVARDARETVDADDLTLRAADDCWIEADPTKLRQLFENLFRNAAEHAGPSVAVTVGSIEPVPTTTRTNAAATRGFYVADDGPGIPEGERASVFDPGYSTDDDGTGFGLSIVEQIAEAHGWSVRVSEAHDGGARFEVVGVEFADDDAGGDPFGG